MKTKIPSKSFKFTSFASALLLSAVMALCPAQSRANTVALDFTGGNTISGADFTWGWSFSLTTSVLLTDLGVWDENSDGLSESHVLSVWTSAGGTPLVQTTISAGLSGTLINDFRYVSVTPTLLVAGDYVIGAYSAQGIESHAWQTNTPTTATEVTYTGGRLEGGSGFPSGDFLSPGSGNAYFGPNFQFLTDHFVGVPEGSSTWMMMILGITCTLGLNLALRRRSAAG